MNVTLRVVALLSVVFVVQTISALSVLIPGQMNAPQFLNVPSILNVRVANASSLMATVPMSVSTAETVTRDEVALADLHNSPPQGSPPQGSPPQDSLLHSQVEGLHTKRV
jgi:hypothetical protein